MTTTEAKNLGGRPRHDESRGKAINKSFAVYQDQIDDIRAVAYADETGSDSAALRALIDEGLRARRARLKRNRKRASGKAKR